MYARILADTLPPEVSYFLFGPRQCGKTTILNSLSSLIYVNLLASKEFIKYNKNPELLYDEVSALSNKRGLIIIDEIQKVPLLLDEVQRCMDKYADLIFILSGSSARKLKRGSANLLGGRAANLSLYPLSLTELSGDFDLEKVLAFGSLPKISTLLKNQKFNAVKKLLNSYVSTYLTEEIKAESLVRSLDYFQRFLEVAAHQHSRETNFSSLADQAGISPNSVKNYFGILEDTLLGVFLHPYSTSIRKELTKTPKFYFFDNGVTRAVKGVVSTEMTHQERGFLFEQLMIQEVIKINSYYEKDFKLNFWKTTSGAEVDLLISRGREILLAVEFKSSPFPGKRDLLGLKSFREDHPQVPVLLCSPVERARMITEQVKVIPPKQLLEYLCGL